MSSSNDTVSRASMRRGWAEYFNERRARFQAAVTNERHYSALFDELEQLRTERPDTLPKHIIDTLVEYHRVAHQDIECAVCLEAMTIENARFTMCGHKVCAQCLEDVREKTPLAQLGRPECPVCRKALNPKYM